ncbi:N-acetylmuramoyl-L-alanine amidase [bacterium]|nr:N-acetylmuramoyl-L-alanine amidase [bacterium]
MIKKCLWMILLLFCTQSFSFTVLIDPGHGGEDHGAVGKLHGKKILEKDIALSISKKVMEYLKKDHHVFLTRSFDRTVSLGERSDLAEKIKADIFVSIHVNSSRNKRGQGFETFYLDNHHDKAVKKVESTENKNLRGDALVINQILTDLIIQNTVVNSKKLASYVHHSVKGNIQKRYKIRDRGVKPGLFYVLALSKRPSILLEVGFMSNTRELKKIKSHKFQYLYAKAVAKGINNYLNALGKKEINIR